jgi:hypothetical protein
LDTSNYQIGQWKWTVMVKTNIMVVSLITREKVSWKSIPLLWSYLFATSLALKHSTLPSSFLFTLYTYSLRTICLPSGRGYTKCHSPPMHQILYPLKHVIVNPKQSRDYQRLNCCRILIWRWVKHCQFLSWEIMFIKHHMSWDVYIVGG